MGQPDIAGKFLRTTGNAPVSSEALGYSCGSRPTTDRVNVSGSYCQTVFFIKKHTMRLAAVSLPHQDSLVQGRSTRVS